MSITIGVSGRAASDLPARLDTGHDRHPDVHQDEVRLQAIDQVDGFATIRGEADDLMSPRLQQRRDPVPEEGMVIGQHDPHQSIPAMASGGLPVATLSATRQPPSGGLVHSIVAPMLSARSRMAR